MRYFKKRLQQEFVRAMRYGKDLSVIMLDLDHFKHVNDNCDHLMGSFVLGEVGRLVARSIRSVDVGARFGGDEYVIMLPETGRDGARAMAERVFRAINEMEFNNGSYSIQISASVGVATMGPGSSEFASSTDLLTLADRNLYAAKRAGRSMIVDGSSSYSSKFA